MKWSKWLEKWEMTSLKVKTPFLETQWEPNDEDKIAAWHLYVELLTRITTQSLDGTHGDEKTALNSVFSLFQTTREILKEHGRHCKEFSRISVLTLNQVIRPFTAKWHKLFLEGALEDSDKCQEFRNELFELQVKLRAFSKLLADMADVEDLTDFNTE